MFEITALAILADIFTCSTLGTSGTSPMTEMVLFYSWHVLFYSPQIVIYLIIQIFQKRKSEYFFISDEVLVVVRASFRNASHVL